MALYKRPNSKFWWMKFYFDGELVQQSTKVANKRDALTIEAAFRHELALGRIGIKPRATLRRLQPPQKIFCFGQKFNTPKKQPSGAKRLPFKS